MKRAFQSGTILRLALACLLVLVCVASAQRQELIHSIEQVTWSKGRASGTTWFLPRLCVLPSRNGAHKFMTLQWITGSDYYGPVHWQEVRGDGLAWSQWSAPQPVPEFDRRPYRDDIEEAVSDVLPEYHAPTRSLIALGQIIYYRNGKYFPEQPPRYPVYVVRDAQGRWSPRRKLEWNDSRGSAIYSTGGAQWLVLKNGDALIPVSFRSAERADFSASTLLCSFDGQQLKVKQVGQELRNPVKRGLLEPSLAFYAGRYYLTLRAEDGFGYVSVSPDGLQWSAPVAWRWDDGEALAMSTTQQHWLAHSDALYLVYTRRTAENEKVFRWRAPLFIARFDQQTLRLLRATERVAVPLFGDPVARPNEVPNLGNFHTANINAQEAWITVGEVIPANFRGDLLLARVRWNRPNRLTASQ